MPDIKIDNTGRQPRDISLKSVSIPDEKTGENFSSYLKNAVDEINRAPIQVEPSIKPSIKNVLPGRETNLYNALLSLEKADFSYRSMMQVRQKLSDAYRQMRTSGLKSNV